MRKLLAVLERINTVLERIVLAGSALLVALIVLVVFGGAITRYITGIGFSTVIELPPMLMPWLVFPLAGVLLRSNSHIAVDFLPDILEDRGKRILKGVVALIAIAAGVTFTIAGWGAASLFRMVGQMTEMEWEFPIWWIYVSFPVGFIILTSFAVENLLRALTGAADFEDEDMRDVRSLSE